MMKNSSRNPEIRTKQQENAKAQTDKLYGVPTQNSKPQKYQESQCSQLKFELSQHAKIATYRTIPVNNIQALLTSMLVVPDLISLYGINIVAENNEENNSLQSNKRKLYNSEMEENYQKTEKMTNFGILEIYLDMLDDERDEIRHTAVICLVKLSKLSIHLTPTMLSRILLKWYNPVTEKQDAKLREYLGTLIDYCVHHKNMSNVMKDAVIPTLSSVLKAPKTSPIVDVDIDNVSLFLAQAMNVSLQKDELKFFILDIVMKISERPSDRLSQHLIKFLLNLNLKQLRHEAFEELIQRFEALLEDVSDKMSRRNVEKLVLKVRHEMTEQEKGENTTQETRNDNTTKETQNGKENDASLLNESQQVKRRKSHSERDCIVVLERLKLNDKKQQPFNETTLHTIVEDSFEMDVDNNLNDSTTSSKKSKATTSSVVISETSDSDVNNDPNVRKSSRIRKKRILHVQ